MLRFLGYDFHAPAAASFLLLSASLTAALAAGCSGGSQTTGTTSSGASSSGTGGELTSSSSSSSSGASGGAGGTSTTSSSTTSSTGVGAGGAGGSTTGTGGTGGTGGGWPTCDAPEPGATQKTLHQIYLDNPTQPTQVWLPGVYVTAVSKGGCQAGVACQLYVQQDLSYPDLSSGSQQAIKVFVSANAATHFTGIQVGQRVDVDAFAWRYNLMGQDELLLQVNLQLKGCAKPVGAGDAQPVSVQLSQLMFTPYDQIGPLLVKVTTVHGKAQAPAETFVILPKTFQDAGPTDLVSLSPFFLPGGTFPAFVSGMTYNFTEVTGVFGIFVPTQMPTSEFREIYPRTTADYTVGP